MLRQCLSSDAQTNSSEASSRNLRSLNFYNAQPLWSFTVRYGIMSHVPLLIIRISFLSHCSMKKKFNTSLPLLFNGFSTYPLRPTTKVESNLNEFTEQDVYKELAKRSVMGQYKERPCIYRRTL